MFRAFSEGGACCLLKAAQESVCSSTRLNSSITSSGGMVSFCCFGLIWSWRQACLLISDQLQMLFLPFPAVSGSETDRKVVEIWSRSIFPASVILLRPELSSLITVVHQPIRPEEEFSDECLKNPSGRRFQQPPQRS